MNKMVKERIIYDNYDLSEMYPDEDLKEQALECGWVDDEEEITDNMLWKWRYEEDEIDWDAAKTELKNFFDGKTVGFFGAVGLWHGTYKAGKVGEFWKLFYEAIKDCPYFKITDENGRMYLTCSHHDGTNHFEIREVTDKGYEYLDRWEYNWSDKRSEAEVHNQIYKRYSKNPNFAHKVYGVKVREYEPMTKQTIIRQLNNEAKSFYSNN